MATEYLNNKVFEGIIARFQKAKKDTARYELIIEDLEGTALRKKKRKAAESRDRELVEEHKGNFRCAVNRFDKSKVELASAFYTLSENLVRYARFPLIDADDAVQEGVMICFEKIDRFDPRKGKAFNYMTTCILNHFRQLYRTARNYNELKKKYLRHLYNIQNKILIKNGREIVSWEYNFS